MCYAEADSAFVVLSNQARGVITRESFQEAMQHLEHTPEIREAEESRLDPVALPLSIDEVSNIVGIEYIRLQIDTHTLRH